MSTFVQFFDVSDGALSLVISQKRAQMSVDLSSSSGGLIPLSNALSRCSCLLKAIVVMLWNGSSGAVNGLQFSRCVTGSTCARASMIRKGRVRTSVPLITLAIGLNH